MCCIVYDTLCTVLLAYPCREIQNPWLPWGSLHDAGPEPSLEPNQLGTLCLLLLVAAGGGGGCCSDCGC